MNIRTRYLPDDEAERLYAANPHVGRSYETWCPTCAKTGSYRWRGEDHPCDCEMQLQLHKWYLASGIGLTYQRLGFDDWAGSAEALEGVSRYLELRDRFLSRGMGLYVRGPYGTGKTMLANLVLKQLVKDGHSVWTSTFSQTVEMFTSGWGDAVEKSWFQRKFLQSRVLLLDDVGLELRGTSIALAETTFDSILRQRVQSGRTTLVTTNLHSSEISQGYGGAVLSLLREKSLEQVVEGPDFRPSANDREVNEVLAGEVRPIT